MVVMKGFFFLRKISGIIRGNPRNGNHRLLWPGWYNFILGMGGAAAALACHIITV